mgnify:CR=1 FL=1
MNGTGFARLLLILCGCALAHAALASSPTVTLGTVASHDPWDGRLDVPYVVQNADPTTDYKVAFEVTAGGRTAAVTNEATRLADGLYSKTLDTAALFGGETTDGGARVRVLLIARLKAGAVAADATGVAVGAAGDVMIVDLSGGPEAASYPVTYERNADLGTFNCEVYKTSKLVLRKVAAGQAYPVAPLADTNALVSANALTPEKSYYIGIFEVTEGQYARVMGGEATSAQKPKGRVSWEDLRGGAAATNAIAADSAECFFQKLCAKCRDANGAAASFDLPTEVQWEIAARAGSTSAYGAYVKDGAAVEGSRETVGEFAVCSCDGELAATAEVGTKSPNAWGLYDTAGNVQEWCRDEYSATGPWLSAETTVTQNVMAILRTLRGGSYVEGAGFARLSSRNNASPGFAGTSPRNGFRLAGYPSPASADEPSGPDGGEAVASQVTVLFVLGPDGTPGVGPAPADPEPRAETEVWNVGEGATAFVQDGVLYVRGEGAVTSAPWATVAGTVESVKIAAGITALPEGALSGMENLAAVNGLAVGVFNDVAAGAVKAGGFTAIAIDPATKTGTVTLRVTRAADVTASAGDWTPVDATGVSTDPGDPTAILVPISAEGPAGFFKLYADE